LFEIRFKERFGSCQRNELAYSGNDGSGNDGSGIPADTPYARHMNVAGVDWPSSDLFPRLWETQWHCSSSRISLCLVRALRDSLSASQELVAVTQRCHDQSIDLSANTERYNLGGIHHGVPAVTMVVGHF
jgi:hypothetical protein